MAKLGWQEDGSYTMDAFTVEASSLWLQILTAGWVANGVNDPQFPADFLYDSWNGEHTALARWIPQNEGARLWLQMNTQS